jgi:ubiquinone/menaquinone biosynthesis C-methylase UbiE
MEKGERENVYKVYNKIAKWFSENRYALLNEDTYLEDMLGRLPPDATILDLGCGTGKPILQYLIEKKLQVTGVDASSQMLNIAKENFPSAEFILQDMRLLHLNRKFDAIIAWHSFFHLQASDQPVCFSDLKNI